MLSSSSRLPAVLRLVLVAAVLTAFGGGCMTAEKAYQRGDYAQAVQLAAKRLKSVPGDAKALDALSRAYPAAEEWFLMHAEAASQSPDPFRWEAALAAYSKLNELALAIRSTPATWRLFPNPRAYTDEMRSAATQAAEARFQAGTALLARGDQVSAREAVGHLTVAARLVPGYKDVAARLETARQMATLKVVLAPVPPTGGGVNLSFLEDKLRIFIAENPPSEFIRFYSAAEAARSGLTAPDQVVQIAFLDFVVQESRLKEKMETHTRDDVVVGRTRGDPPQDVIGTVKADVITCEKSVETQARLDLRIVDTRTNAVLLRQALPGSNVWHDSWGTFRGDERAVPEGLRALTRKREPSPPSRQALFEILADALFKQAATQIRDYYQRYR